MENENEDRGKKRDLSVSPSGPSSSPPPKANKLQANPQQPSQIAEAEASLAPTPSLTIELLAEELLSTKLSANTELSEQSKEIVRLTISITAQLFQTHSSTLTHLHQTVEHLNSSLTKLEQDVIHHDTILREHSKSLKEQESLLQAISLRCDEIIKDKDKQINDLKKSYISLETNYSQLKDDVSNNKYQIDATDQYERRDTLIFSGPDLPRESHRENLPEVIVRMVREHLFLPLTLPDISVCHRLGVRSHNKERPIICKFLSRAITSDVKYSCNFARPDFKLYANESLTPLRREIFYKLRLVKKQHPTLIENLYTIDGNIKIKTLTSEQTETITNPLNLDRFLLKHPVFKECYDNLVLPTTSRD